MRLFVTGANGFIGRHLVSSLSDRYEVFALIRDAGRSRVNEGGYVLDVDLAIPLDRKALPAQIDVVVHLAQANVSFPEDANELLEVNTRSTQHLLDYARRAGAQRFILASTGDVYGRRLGPCKETDRAGAATFYAVTKQAAEMLTQAYAGYFQPCILRLFHPYGPDQANRLIPKLAERIRQRKAVRLNKDNRPHVTPIYIDDAIMTIERAIHSSYAGIVNVAGDRVVSMRDLAEEIGGALKCEARFEESGAESADMIGDNQLMKQVFGACPMITLTDGLSRTFKG